MWGVRVRPCRRVPQSIVVRRHQRIDVRGRESLDEPADYVALRVAVPTECAAQHLTEPMLVELRSECIAGMTLLDTTQHTLELEVGSAQGVQRGRRRGLACGGSVHSALAGGEVRGQPYDGVHGMAGVERLRRLLVCVGEVVDEPVIGAADRLCGHGRFLP